MDVTGLRVALFSGNYNYVRDGANQALNRFVGYLLRQGANVRVYSPTTDTPAFEPAGDLVSTPSFPVPGRREYQVPYRMSGAVRRDGLAFHWLDFVAPIGIGGIWIAAFIWVLKRQPILLGTPDRFEIGRRALLPVQPLLFEQALQPILRVYIAQRTTAGCPAGVRSIGAGHGRPHRHAGVRCRRWLEALPDNPTTARNMTMLTRLAERL